MDIIHHVNGTASRRYRLRETPLDDSYLERWIEPQLAEATKQLPVLVLTGARQTGKSTLLRRAKPFRSWRYQTLDDPDVASAAERDPASLFEPGAGTVLDEVQKAPALLHAVKWEIDRKRGTRFVLLGSANLLLMSRVGESLAGRAAFFHLGPMTLGETAGRPMPPSPAELLDFDASGASVPPAPPPAAPLLLRGFLPPVLSLRGEELLFRWWDGYVASYLERDLRQLARVDALADFRRLMELAALRTGCLANQTDLARDGRMSQPTVHRHLNLLETSHLLERIPGYTAGRSARLVKSPKIHWADPGLATFLCRLWSQKEVEESREKGGLFETLVFHHLRVLAGLTNPKARLFHWRRGDGAEVDFVWEHGRTVVAVEAKLGSRPASADADGLRKFLADHPDAKGGILVHGGKEARRLDRKIVALPWTALAG
jgi:predicted AAA+ superfamily ATPase